MSPGHSYELPGQFVPDHRVRGLGARKLARPGERQTMRTLTPEPLTAEAFALFGAITEAKV